MGSPRAWVSSRTIRYSSGCCCSVTGFERLLAMAIRSENQYIARLKTSANTRAMVAPVPRPTAYPIATNRPPSAAMRIQVFTRLIPVISSSFSDEKDLRRMLGEGLAVGFLPPGPAPSRVRLDGRPAWATPLRWFLLSHAIFVPGSDPDSPSHQRGAGREPR